MNIEMTLPDLSTTGGSVRIIRWLVEAGQVVERGQPLLEVETDKATLEIEAYISGVVVEILAGPGVEVEAGQAIARLATGQPNSPVPQAKASAQTTAGKAGALPDAPLPPAGLPAAPRTGMFARNREKIAREPATTPPPHRATWVQTAAQRVVARRMQESKQTIPHFYLQTSANAEAAARRREAAPGEKPAWDAFFVFALGKALMQYPRLSASYVDGELQPQNADAVGVAVDQGGDLFICPITHPAAKTPEQIGVELAEWLRHLQNGDPLARKIQPANLTVTNLGGTGVEAFAAVINPPEAAILAVGKVAPAAVVADGQVTVQRRVMLTLSVDHRVVNGRYAAEFLAEVVRQFESL